VASNINALSTCPEKSRVTLHKASKTIHGTKECVKKEVPIDGDVGQDICVLLNKEAKHRGSDFATPAQDSGSAAIYFSSDD
jgi:hypothetical protein